MWPSSRWDSRPQAYGPTDDMLTAVLDPTEAPEDDLPEEWPNSMDEIIPGLWLGDFVSARDARMLNAKGIGSVVSVLRGPSGVHQRFIRHQIELDDIEDADILSYLPGAIQFIDSELAKGRGVLVHCQAGISRSSTIVAAYLMAKQKSSPEEALDIVRSARPVADPNAGFRRQLDIFHQSQYRVAEKDAGVRKFYQERRVRAMRDGRVRDRAVGALLETTIMSTPIPAPQSTPPSNPTTKRPSRRIRCKMCRMVLAARVHMLDHGQIGPATPPGSRRNSLSEPIASSATSENSTATPTPAPKTANPIASDDANISTSASVSSGASAPPTASTSNLPISYAPDGKAFVDMAALRPRTAAAPSSAATTAPPAPAPILVNPQCSGYFLEPMKWMGPLIDSGDLAGKITCPNQKCKAKLGNFDWAGQHCGCKQWVTPGFCINRSKVDEVTILV